MNLASSHYHFIGIGGIGMCGLAELLFEMGACVTGSDPAQNIQINRLQKLGIKIFSEHHRDNIGEADVVVYSSAIPPGHIERIAAREKQIPLIPRAEALAELMRLKRGIAVAGTHGKTTTTSLLASSFMAADRDPTIVIGGRLEIIGRTAQLGQGPWLIAEADESDGSFSKLSPEIVVLTNIDNDHLDFYGSFDNLEKAFYNFCLQVPFYGLIVACGDDPVVCKLLREFPKKVRFYGFSQHNDYRLSESKSGTGEDQEFIVHRADLCLGKLKVNLPGRHNALNALAAIAAGIESDPEMDVNKAFAMSVKGIENFKGVDRRAQLKGEARGVSVFDDYGHHPTEVRAVLRGFKEKFPHRRLLVCFQPHRYSRTQICWQEFLESFADADVLYLTEVYAAGEKPMPGVSGERMASEIVHPKVRFLESDAATEILKEVRSGDVILTLGAGDGWEVGVQILAQLSSKHE